MTKLKTTEKNYRAPECWDGKLTPWLLCQSLTEGSLEDLTEEDWTL